MKFDSISLFIYILNIIDINSQQKKIFAHQFIQKFLSQEYYNKIIEKYDINFKIIEKENIKEEILINSSYSFINDELDFSYSGQLFYLNETNVDSLSKQNEYKDDNFIFLINSELTLNDCISKFNNIIIKKTKAIIIPSNLIDNINQMAMKYYSELSIYLIKIKEDIFSKLIQTYIYSNSNNTNYNIYYGIIKSKRHELFSYLNINIIIIILSLIFILTLIFMYFRSMLDARIKIKCYDFIYNILKCKCIIFLLLLFQLHYFNDLKGFYNYNKPAILFYITIMFIIITKYSITSTFIFQLTGILLYIRVPKVYIKIIEFLSIMNLILHYINECFINLEHLNSFLILYILIIFMVFFVNIRNIIYLFKINSKLKRKHEKYKRTIKIKIFILISQLFSFILYIFFFSFLTQYFSFKKDLYFIIEKYILFESLDILLLIKISILYIILFTTFGFSHYIYIKKSNKKIQTKPEYISNIPKSISSNDNSLSNFIENNFRKTFIVLSPKAFFYNKKQIKDDNAIAIKSKIGKIYIN
jgi:hypothetical protein